MRVLIKELILKLESVTTIYENAVPIVPSPKPMINNGVRVDNRLSTSSEEGGLNTSDESNADLNMQLALFNRMNFSESHDNAIPDVRKSRGECAEVNEPQPSTSTGRRQSSGGVMRRHLAVHDERQHMLSPEESAEKLIHEAESKKARKVATPGNDIMFEGDINKQFHLVLVDEDYLLVAAHVDSSTFNKIVSGEYVDFAKLLPRDKIVQEEDNHLEMVFRGGGGQMYWVPAKDRDAQAIQNFNKWEQAFWVYLDIYLRRYPSRSTELIQYNHIIYSASLGYIWENVYSYDRDFRLHLGRHPDRSWGIILQQAWAMRLKDQIGSVSDAGHHGNHGNLTRKTSPRDAREVDDHAGIDINDICRRYNKGRCSFGPTCRYEHCCLYCFKFGHSILNCRKLKSHQSSDSDRRSGKKDHDRKRRDKHREHNHAEGKPEHKAS